MQSLTTLTDTIKFEVSGEKYYTLTIRSEGPLYAMTSNITGLSDNKLVIAAQGRQGTTATYKIAKGSGSGPAAAGIQISLYDSVDYAGAPVATATHRRKGRCYFQRSDCRKDVLCCTVLWSVSIV